MCLLLFFFKQKTAYGVRISDWSSDVCASDLGLARFRRHAGSLVIDAQLHPIAVASCRNLDQAFIGRKADCVVNQVLDDPAEPALFAHDHRRTRFRPRERTSAVAFDTACLDRKSVVSGKRWSVRVDLGGSRLIKTKKQKK